MRRKRKWKMFCRDEWGSSVVGDCSSVSLSVENNTIKNITVAQSHIQDLGFLGVHVEFGLLVVGILFLLHTVYGFFLYLFLISFLSRDVCLGLGLRGLSAFIYVVNGS